MVVFSLPPKPSVVCTNSKDGVVNVDTDKSAGHDCASVDVEQLKCQVSDSEVQGVSSHAVDVVVENVSDVCSSFVSGVQVQTDCPPCLSNSCPVSEQGSQREAPLGCPKCVVYSVDPNGVAHTILKSAGDDVPRSKSAPAATGLGDDTQSSTPCPTVNHESIQLLDLGSTQPQVSGHFGSYTGSVDPMQLEQFTAYLHDIFYMVYNTGMYNFMGARVPLPSAVNVDKWEELLEGYHDSNITTFLHYGWPINYDRRSLLSPTHTNHPSALQYPEDIQHYVDTEIAYQAMWGPFSSPPTPYLHTSPLMTRPKKDSDHRRVILDLSWPAGGSINEGVPSDVYVDGEYRMHLPTVEYLAGRIRELGKGAWLYKTDLSRGYRQLRTDPLDWPLIAFRFRDNIYLDICPAFGLRSSAAMMQRVTEAVVFIHEQAGFRSRSYIDDFFGAEACFQDGSRAARALRELLEVLGLAEAVHKAIGPVQVMVCLGILFDTIQMIMCIPEEKIRAFRLECREWLSRQFATRRQVQRLLGLINFISAVAPTAKVFSNRILSFLRSMPNQGKARVDDEVRADISFFIHLLPEFNGIRILDKSGFPPDYIVELDACLQGCGAIAGEEFYAVPFPARILAENHPIAHLELLNIVVALKLWAHRWRGKVIRIYCDNMNSCMAVQSGRSRVPFMQRALREIFLYTTSHDVELSVNHAPGASLVLADALSRAYVGTNTEWSPQVRDMLQGRRRVWMPDDMFAFLCDL